MHTCTNILCPSAGISTPFGARRHSSELCRREWQGQQGDLHTLQVAGRPVNLSAFSDPIPGAGQTAKGCESKWTRHGVIDTRWLRRNGRVAGAGAFLHAHQTDVRHRARSPNGRARHAHYTASAGEMGQGVVCSCSHHAGDFDPRRVLTEHVEAHMGIVERLVGTGPNEQGKHLARDRQAGRQANTQTDAERQTRMKGNRARAGVSAKSGGQGRRQHMHTRLEFCFQSELPQPSPQSPSTLVLVAFCPA